MKNSVDKPLKASSKSRWLLMKIYLFLEIIVFIILIVALTLLYIESKPSKLVGMSEINFKPNEIPKQIILEARAEVIKAPEPKVETKEINEPIKSKDLIISRGEVPKKQPSQRDIINNYVREIASKYNISPELIMSVIVSESNYNPNCLTGQARGLMQVNPRWHGDRAKRLGVTNFYDPYGNILLGVDYLCELKKQYKDIRLVLMLYNMDHNTAIKMFKNGQISYYAKTILTRAEQLKKGE